MNLAGWRKLTRQPSGVLMTLLLIVLLAFGSRPCLMPVHADPAPPLAAHDCCPDPATPPDAPTNPLSSSCHDGHCLQAISDYGAADRHESLSSNPDWPSQPLAVVGLLPPDWLNSGYSPPILVAATTGPPPPQRSRVLRL